MDSCTIERLELIGSDSEMKAQLRLNEEEAWVGTQPGLVSEGRVLMILDYPTRSESSALSLAKRFIWSIIACPIPQKSEIEQALKDDGCTVHGNFDLMTGHKTEMVSQLESARALVQEPDRYEFRELSSDTSKSLVKEVQSLQVRSGLDPQPGFFLRKNNRESFTLALLDVSGTLCGCIAVVSMNNMGPCFADSFLLICIAVEPKFRGKKLSYLMISEATRLAFDRMGASKAHVIVSKKNVASLNVNLNCGMKMDSDNSFVLAEFPSEVDRVQTRTRI